MSDAIEVVLGELQAEIDRLRDRLQLAESIHARLRQLVEDGKPAPASAKPTRPPAAPKPAALPAVKPAVKPVAKPAVTRSGSVQLDRRRQVAEYLRTHGPTRQARLCELLGIPNGSMTSVIQCDWFEPEADGLHLTMTGRLALQQPAPARGDA